MAEQKGRGSKGRKTPEAQVVGLWWLQQTRLQAQLTQPQKRQLEQLHDLLLESPSAERPVNGTTIFAEVLRIAWDQLTEEGLLEREPEKSALDLFREGKKAREAKAREEAAARRVREAQESRARDESENGDEAKPDDAGGLELPELREGAKILPECRDPGKCHHCEKPFAAQSRVVWEPPEVKGAEGRTWGPGCCEVAKRLLAQLAEAA